MILGVIAKYGTDFATGYVIEYTGEAIRELSMEERMTVCNMSIEGGARAGMIAPDETTFEYLRGRQYVPQGEAFDRSSAWKELVTDEGAEFDVVVEFDVESLIPQVTWGTSPGMGTDISSTVPNPADFKTENERKARRKRWSIWRLYQGRQCPKFRSIMSLSVLARMDALKICVRRRSEGHKVSSNVTAIVVPGSGRVKIQAEQEGLDKILLKRVSNGVKQGSMCLAMNPDVLKPGQRAHPRPIVTSKDAKAAAAERISYRRQWRGSG